MTRTLGSIALSLLLAAPAGAADWTGKVLRLGVDPTYPPLEYKQPDGRLAGFGIEIGEALCAELRARCEWVESNWDGIIPALLRESEINQEGKARKLWDIEEGKGI
ncbi:hypothetical protein YQ19_12560 [Pseudomonas aeruginosa]|nr:hypothetical protein YQ19_12560 [Pseudomonas aeruginosa]ARG51979.1 hypothetical protein BFV99_22375 [Pseudomonas aeruginosa]